MPRTATKTDTVYKFDELSEQAKEKARDKWREGELDYEWWDSVYEDARAIGEILGIQMDNINFSGFCSQSHGARFNGSYRFKKGWRKALDSYMPVSTKVDGKWVYNERNAEMHRLAMNLQKAQASCFYRLEAVITYSGRYEHSGCTTIDVSDSEYYYRDIGDAEDDIADNLRGIMDWIYSQLEREHDWRLADEQIDESIKSGEVEFLESGEVYR